MMIAVEQFRPIWKFCSKLIARPLPTLSQEPFWVNWRSDDNLSLLIDQKTSKTMSSPDKPSQLTPMLRQYHEIKKQHPGTLL
ncbi:MAG: hypothetical protein ACRD5H_14435, partial [Nitrososphaerales archaeon]